MKKETDLQKRTREEMESHTTGGPKTGVNTLARKINPNGEGQAEPYRFNQDNKVGTAAVQEGVAKRCVEIQEGTNKSSMPPACPPLGSKKEE